MQVTSTSPPAALGSARRTAAGACSTAGGDCPAIDFHRLFFNHPVAVMGIFLLVIGVVGIV
jgi:hypothetical protein